MHKDWRLFGSYLLKSFENVTQVCFRDME